MATVLEAPAHADAPRPWIVTARRYYRMIEAGVLGKADRVYLRHGQIVEKMTKNPPHANTVTTLHGLLFPLVLRGFHLRQEQPIEYTATHVPEPDFAFVRGQIQDYRKGPPTARDVALVIEVADSSLAQDRGPGLIDNAAAGVPIYWIVNLVSRQIEVYTRPIDPSYGLCTICRPGETIPVELDGQPIGLLAVDDILPDEDEVETP